MSGSKIPATKDPLTERIEAAISDAGLYKRTVAALSGNSPWIWERKSRTGTWTTGDVRRIAEITGASFARLVGDPDEEEGAA